MNPVQSYPTSSNRDREGVWQVVQRKDKGEKIVEGAGMVVSLRASPQHLAAIDMDYFQSYQVPGRVTSTNLEGCGASSSKYVLYSISDTPSICENRTSIVPINNSFNGIIPDRKSTRLNSSH